MSLFSGALCLPQCQGRCCLLLPPSVSHEISWPQMWLHHVCQVLSFMEKKLNDFLILYVLSITLYCIFCDILLHQGDLSTRPVLARWVFWDAGVWMEAKKSPKHDVLLVRKVLHRYVQQCVTLKVWGAKAGSRGNVEEDRRHHRLWLDRRGDSGSCSLQWISLLHLTMTILRDWTSTWSLTTTRSPAHWT